MIAVIVTKNTPYLTLTGELWGVCCEYLRGNWPCYNGTTLCLTHWPLGNFNEVLVNTLRPRQNRRHFADYVFKCNFLNENVWIPIKISLKFVPKGPIDDIPTLVQIMAWRQPGDKPLSEPSMVSLLTHICVTRPQWVKMVGTSLMKFLPGESHWL